ncbi:MAG: hypothetical protein IT562_20790 [Alphaproteobacteria bacterium]|nr:hypothetical protein [Alphaproteobacteria bacterium]
MPLDITLALLAAAAALLGFSILRVRRPREPGNPRLVDWHYVMFPAIVLTGLLALHAVMLVLGR